MYIYMTLKLLLINRVHKKVILTWRTLERSILINMTEIVILQFERPGGIKRLNVTIIVNLEEKLSKHKSNKNCLSKFFIVGNLLKIC